MTLFTFSNYRRTVKIKYFIDSFFLRLF
jgi:hypothetical protein